MYKSREIAIYRNEHVIPDDVKRLVLSDKIIILLPKLRNSTETWTRESRLRKMRPRTGLSSKQSEAFWQALDATHD